MRKKPSTSDQASAAALLAQSGAAPHLHVKYRNQFDKYIAEQYDVVKEAVYLWKSSTGPARSAARAHFRSQFELLLRFETIREYEADMALLHEIVQGKETL